MRLGHLSYALRREVFNAVRQFLLKVVERIPNGYRYVERFTERTLGQFHNVVESEIARNLNCKQPLNWFERYLIDNKFNKVLDLIEIVLNTVESVSIDIEIKSRDLKILICEFPVKIDILFNEHAAAYWLDISQRPYRFFPRTSKEEGEAVQQAIKIICQGDMKGAVTHLREAAKFINTGDHSDSIRESIHAVESIARTIDPTSSKALGPALKSLEEAGILKHKALKEAFMKLYGYASDEQGIRHSLLDQSSADVGLDEAIFMFGACASFAAYLSKKHQTLGRA